MKVFLLFLIATLFLSELTEGTFLPVLNDKITYTANKVTIEVVTTYQNVSLEECVAKAKQQVHYTTINFAVATTENTKMNNSNGTSQQLGNCQVLTTKPPSDYVIDDHRQHHDNKTDPCNPNPCKYRGVCQPNDTDDFECSCNYPMGGKTCEHTICNSCYRKNDLIIFVNTTIPSTTWSESYEYCRSRGLTLFLDNNIEKHEFVVAMLNRQHFTKPYVFWIGLNRTSASSKFEYVDRTPLNNSYTPWVIGRPSNELCVQIGNTVHWNWSDDNCEGMSLGYNYYPLCEKNYPFLLE